MAQNIERKDKTRQSIVKAASAGFRAHGYAGVGVDAIAKTAGVTSGAFYAHLGSKDAAFDITVKAALEEMRALIAATKEKAGEDWLQALVEYYFSLPHVDDLAGGCPMTSLSPEVARAKPETKAIFAKGMQEIAGMIASALPGETDEERLARAWSFLGHLSGNLTMMRALGENVDRKAFAQTMIDNMQPMWKG